MKKPRTKKTGSSQNSSYRDTRSRWLPRMVRRLGVDHREKWKRVNEFNSLEPGVIKVFVYPSGPQATGLYPPPAPIASDASRRGNAQTP